jgi:hypothetical protein
MLVTSVGIELRTLRRDRHWVYSDMSLHGPMGTLIHKFGRFSVRERHISESDVSFNSQGHFRLCATGTRFAVESVSRRSRFAAAFTGMLVRTHSSVAWQPN